MVLSAEFAQSVLRVNAAGVWNAHILLIFTVWSVYTQFLDFAKNDDDLVFYIPFNIL